MNIPITILKKSDDSYIIIPGLPDCAGYGKTLEEALENMKEILETKKQKISCVEVKIDKDISPQINSFIATFNRMYPDIDLRVEYNSDEDYCHIYHSYKDYYKDNEFNNSVGFILRDMLYNNDIYNFSFGYKEE